MIQQNQFLKLPCQMTHNFEAKKKSQLNDELTNVEFQRKQKVNTTIPVQR